MRGPDGCVKPGMAVFGTEDDVNDDLAEGLRHNSDLFGIVLVNRGKSMKHALGLQRKKRHGRPKALP